MEAQHTWIIEDHLCRSCGGRILRAATEDGHPWVGIPLYRCANCGVSIVGKNSHELCWCAYSHQDGRKEAKFSCVPKAILESRPELSKMLHSTEGEIGVLFGQEPREEIKENAA